ALFPHSLHDALPICGRPHTAHLSVGDDLVEVDATSVDQVLSRRLTQRPENRPMVIAPVEVVIVQAHDGPLRGRVASQPLRDALSAQVIQLILDPAVPAEALVGVHVHAGEHRAIHGDREVAILIALQIPSADILSGQAVKVVRESHGVSPFCSVSLGTAYHSGRGYENDQEAVPSSSATRLSRALPRSQMASSPRSPARRRASARSVTMVGASMYRSPSCTNPPIQFSPVEKESEAL